MNVNRIWSPEAVRDLLRDALAITAELEPPLALEVAVFGKAADLLAATIAVQQAPPPIMPLPDLRGRRH